MTIVEDEQELGAVGSKTLKGVRMAAWEVPQVTLLEVIDEVAAFLVKSCNPDFAFKDICPFSLDVPVKFSDHAFIKTHVHASKLNACWELSDGGLTCPATFLHRL